MAKKECCSCCAKGKPCKSAVKSHLRGDIKGFKKEIKEDEELIRKLKNGKTVRKSKKGQKKARRQ